MEMEFGMCQCKEVKRADVLYHMDQGNRMVPYHKDCGEDLSEDQKKQIDVAQRQKWGIVR